MGKGFTIPESAPNSHIISSQKIQGRLVVWFGRPPGPVACLKHPQVFAISSSIRRPCLVPRAAPGPHAHGGTARRYPRRWAFGHHPKRARVVVQQGLADPALGA